MTDTAGDRILRDVSLGFMRIHVLHHAAEGPIFGLEMMEELRRHGYRVGPGTLYPLLHALENAGLLRARQQLVAGKHRKYYRTTPAGDLLLRRLRERLAELVDEVAEGHGAKRGARSRRSPRD